MSPKPQNETVMEVYGSYYTIMNFKVQKYSVVSCDILGVYLQSLRREKTFLTLKKKTSD